MIVIFKILSIYNPYLIDNYIKICVINKIIIHMWRFSQNNPVIETIINLKVKLI